MIVTGYECVSQADRYWLLWMSIDTILCHFITKRNALYKEKYGVIVFFEGLFYSANRME